MREVFCNVRGGGSDGVIAPTLPQKAMFEPQPLSKCRDRPSQNSKQTSIRPIVMRFHSGDGRDHASGSASQAEE